jgi:hypothetical protein
VLDFLASNIDDSALKMLPDCKYSFHILAQYSQGSNVLDTPASNKHGFNQEIQSFFHPLNGAILHKGDVPHT